MERNPSNSHQSLFPLSALLRVRFDRGYKHKPVPIGGKKAMRVMRLAFVVSIPFFAIFAPLWLSFK